MLLATTMLCRTWLSSLTPTFYQFYQGRWCHYCAFWGDLREKHIMACRSVACVMKSMIGKRQLHYPYNMHYLAIVENNVHIYICIMHSVYSTSHLNMQVCFLKSVKFLSVTNLYFLEQSSMPRVIIQHKYPKSSCEQILKYANLAYFG